jgi:hypothetical protein
MKSSWRVVVYVDSRVVVFVDSRDMAIGLPDNCVNHNINLPNLQRDLCQNLEEHQLSLLLEIQL